MARSTPSTRQVSNDLHTSSPEPRQWERAGIGKPRRRSALISALFVGASLYAVPSIASAQSLAAPAPQVTAGNEIQSPSAPAPKAAAGSENIIVTGTRLPSGFAAPTPVTSISAAHLMATSPNDLATGLAQVPSLNSSILSTNAGSASGAAGTNGQSLLNLRGLGANRTLVLLDGRRLGPTNVQDAVDINIIPQSLLKRVDIVTGGASANYGSDAVAGVVNFILDTNYEGFKADINYGQTTYNDARNGSLSLAFGKALGHNVRVIAGLDLAKRGGIGLPPTGREWNDNPWVGYSNPVSGALPTFIVVPNARSSNGTYGGLITAVQGCATAACKSLVNQQFGPGGALLPFTQGATPGSNYASGGDGADMVFGITPAMDRESGFLHTEVDVNPALTLFAEGLFNRTFTSNQAQPAYQTGSVATTIFRNNAFLPAAVASVFAANPTLTSFTMGRISPDITVETVKTLEKVARVSTGAKGELGPRWSYDASISYQHTVNNIDVVEPIKRNLYAAIDAVVDPASGRIVCRSTLSGLDPACVPIDLFGAGSPSAAAINYVVGLNRGDNIYQETAFEANIRGDLGDRFSLTSQPISVAAGVAARHDTASRTVDALSAITTTCAGLRGCPASINGQYGGYQYYDPGAFSGSTSAQEVYGELGIPLLKDQPLFKSLSADIAGRWTHYSVSGGQWTYKLGLQWSLSSDLRFRGTFSQDARAPDVLELFSPASTKVTFNLFPYSTAPTTMRVSAINAATGSTHLLPEIAHTMTFGAVLSPTSVPGLHVSVDYYDVRIKQSIEALAAQGVIDGCAQGNQAYCQLITVNGVPITSTTQVTGSTTGVVVTGPRANVGRETTSGIDIETNYSHRLGNGTLTATGIGNILLKVNRPTAITGCAQTDLLGAIGGCLGENGYARWKANFSLSYDTGPFHGFVQERLISHGRADPWDVVGVTVNRNSVPLVAYTDFTLEYALAPAHIPGRAYLTVTNLFNRAPPPTIISAGAFDAMTSYDVYDVLGRRFLIGYRVNF